MLDAYSLTNRGFFALMQTGNLISVFINLVKGDWNSLLVSFIVVITFIIGLILSNFIEYIYEKLIIRNHGQFIPQSVEEVLMNDCPESEYRNPFLAEAMRNVKMIETEGGGIKKLFGQFYGFWIRILR